MRVLPRSLPGRIGLGFAVFAVAALTVGSIAGGTGDRLGGPAEPPSPAHDPGAPFDDGDFAGGLGLSDRGFDASAQEGPFAADEEVAPGDRDIIGAGSGLFGERIIRSALLRVEVAEGRFEEAWDRAFDVAADLGGSVLSSSRGGEEPEPFLRGPAGTRGVRTVPVGELVIRVPVERFEQAMVRLRALGTVLSDRISSRDVTGEFVDLESRLRHHRAQETALLALLERAESVSDVLAVQGHLADVQLQIEQITGRIRFLRDQTELSTITLRLAEPGGLAAPPGERAWWAEAWATAARGLERMAQAGIIGGTWLAPFALAGAIWVGVRRRRTPGAGSPEAGTAREAPAG